MVLVMYQGNGQSHEDKMLVKILLWTNQSPKRPNKHTKEIPKDALV